MTTAAPTRPARKGFRWVRGLFTHIRAARTRVSDPYDPAKPLVMQGEIERTVGDSCLQCYLRVHQAEDCNNPRVTEWFEIDDRDDPL